MTTDQRDHRDVEHDGHRHRPSASSGSGRRAVRAEAVVAGASARLGPAGAPRRLPPYSASRPSSCNRGSSSTACCLWQTAAAITNTSRSATSASSSPSPGRAAAPRGNVRIAKRRYRLLPPATRPTGPRSGAARGAGPSHRHRSGASRARPRARQRREPLPPAAVPRHRGAVRCAPRRLVDRRPGEVHEIPSFERHRVQNSPGLGPGAWLIYPSATRQRWSESEYAHPGETQVSAGTGIGAVGSAP
jgi:hypothetical protein